MSTASGASGASSASGPAAAARHPRTEAPSTLELYRDDGPLARALSGFGRFVPLPPALLIAIGFLPVLALMVVEGVGASDAVVGGAVGWLVVCGALSAGRPHLDRLRWSVPPLLRLCEYATLVWIGAEGGESSRPAAFAFICALTFRHYDLVYRMRHQGVAPPRWLGNLALGWDGRLLLGYLLLVAGALPAGFFVAAGLLAAVFAAETVAGWRRFGRAQQPATYEDEEDEGQ